MADKDVEIRIGTTADTSGAEKEVEAIEQITEATKELSEVEKDRARRKAEYEQRMATPGYSDPNNPMAMPASVMGPERTEEIEKQTDAVERQNDAVDEAIKRIEEIGDKSEEAAPKLDKLIGINRAQVAQQFSQFLGGAARFMRSLSDEMTAADIKGSQAIGHIATGLDSLSAGAQGAATGFATGGPLGAAIGGLVGLLSGPLKNAISGTVNDLKALKQSEDDAAAAARTLKAAHDAVNTERQRNSLFEFFERGKQAITAAIAEYERFVKVRDATSAADSSIRQTQANTALARGASPFQIGAAGTQSSFDARIAELENEIADAQKRAEFAEQKATQAELDAKSAKVNDSTTQADVDNLRGEAKTAREAADEAQKNAETAVLVAEQKLREVIAEKDAQVEEAFTNIGDEAAERGRRILDLVNGASKQGETLTTAQKESAERLQQILSDGTVAQEEQARFQADLKTIITSLGNQGKEAQEANKLFLQAITSMETNNRTFIEITRNMQRRQEQMETELRELREQSLNPTQPR